MLILQHQMQYSHPLQSNQQPRAVRSPRNLNHYRRFSRFGMVTDMSIWKQSFLDQQLLKCMQKDTHFQKIRSSKDDWQPDS